MLKSRYTFKLIQPELQQLNNSVDLVYERFGRTKELELALPITVLKDFKCRLVSKLVFPKDRNTVFLKSSEALAFMVLYRHGIIPANLATSSIAQQIDRTL